VRPRRAGDALLADAGLSGRRNGRGRSGDAQRRIDRFSVGDDHHVEDALEAIGTLVANLALGVRGASSITLIAAALVLGGALARVIGIGSMISVILKTLGATRRQLIAAYALEYALLGLATALFGVAVGSLAAWRVVVDVMNLGYVWLPGPALAAAFGALAVTVGLGLAGTFTALGRKPAPVFRSVIIALR